MGLLLVDFILNSILINPKQWLISFTIMLVYMLVNLWITIQRGFPVYPIMTWKDSLTVIFAIAGLISAAVFFLLFAYLSILKKRKFEKSSLESLRGSNDDLEYEKQVNTKILDSEDQDISEITAKGNKADLRSSSIQD